MELTKKGFQLPDRIFFQEDSLTDRYGVLYAGPLERGFGTTLGNSLRRVLISSIEGAAVTSIRIPGVMHEFSIIPGVVEDIIDIIMNVKSLRFNLNSEKARIAKISVTGPHEVKGKDIISDPLVKNLNPEQHILTLDKDIYLEMEMTVKKGKGYCPSENNKEDDHTIDVLAVDSLFSPITNVNFWVESARVGQATDYDKLVMEIWTDGSISPPKAVTQAANILIDHILLFSLEDEEPQGEEKEDQTDFEDKRKNININLIKTIDELELSVRSHNCLKNANIKTIADLVQKTENEMLKTKNFGRKSLLEIKEILKSMDLHFGMKVDQEAVEALREKIRQSEESGEENAIDLAEDLSIAGGNNAT
jgi:DNA-directed RNA polymerase subunit alpha